MFLILSSILALALLSYSAGNVPDTPVTSFAVTDTSSIDVVVYFDNQGLPELYGARIYTPVCEVDKCYVIEIDFYWDIIGRFQYYDSIPGKGLTKLDHIPFTNSDYLKLTEILINRYSMLAAYEKENIVRDTRSSDIDGITGATINELRQDVIEGAVYSCYTLWHIAYGPVTDSIRKATSGLFSKKLVQKMVNLEDQEISYFLINNLTEGNFVEYLPEVLETIDKAQGYYAKNAIELMPARVINDPLSMDFFAVIFDRMDYFTKVALLEKLDANLLNEALRDALSRDANTRNSYKNQLIKSLLSEGKNDP